MCPVFYLLTGDYKPKALNPKSLDRKQNGQAVGVSRTAWADYGVSPHEQRARHLKRGKWATGLQQGWGSNDVNLGFRV